MSKSFGELVNSAIDEIEGMDPLKLAKATGLSRNRIYQVIAGQGGVPRRWWEISDALKIRRHDALLGFSEQSRKSAYDYLKKAGKADSVPSAVASDIEKIVTPTSPPMRKIGNLSGVKYIGISPAQSRAGRALLGWSQFDLSERCGLSQSAISDFEAGAKPLILSSQNLIWAALTRAGVTVLQPGSTKGGGEGVRFAATK